MTLTVLAAGLGSRFEGGLKQLAKVGKNGETIMELNIKNAQKAGFNKVVFIIREELKKDFDELIIPNIDMDYAYAYQKNDLIKDREKPLGTGHALLTLKDIVKEDFAIIDADDYYTLDSFIKIKEFFKTNKKDHIMVAYKLKNTVFVSSDVNRGICQIENDKLKEIVETKKIKKINDKFLKDEKQLDENSLVSMNLWGFRPSIFPFFERELNTFLNSDIDLLKDEFLIPTTINKLIQNKEIEVYIKKTDSKCIGITYKEDIKLFNEIIN